jgi:hypothetical protein
MASDRDRVIIAEAISKCWQDEAFKAKFISDPAGELKAAGMDIAAGTKVEVFESTDSITYLTLSHDVPLEQYGLKLGKAIAAKMPMKPGNEIRLVSTGDNYLPICLPLAPKWSAGEMSDAELMSVAGGDYTAVNVNVVQSVNAATTANAAAVVNVAGATNAVGAAEAVVVAAVVI